MQQTFIEEFLTPRIFNSALQFYKSYFNAHCLTLFDVTPLDHGKVGAETCRGENELEIEVK
jgi:hypothetical protein